MVRSILCISRLSEKDEYATHRKIFELKSKFATYNKMNKVGGVLAYKKGQLLQVLQGDEANIEHLISKMESCDGANSFNLLIDQTIPQKVYRDWRLVFTRDEKESMLFSHFLRQHINSLTFLEDQELSTIENFVTNVFH